ncbi:transglutaminase family protein [Echinicola jeungdonensis]|uniref:Transglutaminase N-terminal domain-containing protein n=1 Tax=Echinicola jeungdonensis TaxID=709343 RepID=A0ABV5J997_9BACT|nr:transglutaminase family protein [Echinicola jeungdonensis]MDN3670506.1 transglutaminase family protein [Echinicola jeungdonensis]
MIYNHNLQIRHKTVYHYSKPVELNPHQVFLIPSLRTYFRVNHYDIKISPNPAGTFERISLEGNPFQQFWFDKPTESLQINVDIELFYRTFNPFGFLLDPDFGQLDDQGNLQVQYPASDHAYLKAYLVPHSSPVLMAFSQKVKSRCQDILGFLIQLTAEVHGHCKHLIREDEGIWPPEKCLNEKKGSCRDLSWLLIQLLRGEGIACRFVSGYAFNPELEEGHELHAWVEAYYPGAGWIGLDPNLGLLTDHLYFPLTASFDPSHTLPVQGTYGGTAESKMESYVEIKSLPLKKS